jgi:SAM-dependent methyltransferase
MPVTKIPTANSKTKISYHSDWLVLDIGSGHNPHPRANVLTDRFLEDDLERSGQQIALPEGVPFIIADASALPFKDKAFDFIICSHVAEHIDPSNVDNFCSELNRVGKAGYIETPSKIAEYLRHSQVHRWIISNRGGQLVFTPILSHDFLGWFGKLIRSLMFYGTTHAQGYQNVYSFTRGVSNPWHYFFLFFRRLIYFVWKTFKPIFYTRLLWENNFSWQIMKRPE